MVTQNVINGFVIPDDIAEIRDFPREFKISTVDFVYQRIAFLIECFPLRKEIIETEVIDYHKELNQMAKNKKIVFCGGQQNFVNMLRNAQPDISYVDQCNLATCDALIANSDIVIFRVTQMSHSLYGKAKQICKARGIRFEHLPNVTSIPLTEELIYTLITKKEATGNE